MVSLYPIILFRDLISLIVLTLTQYKFLPKYHLYLVSSNIYPDSPRSHYFQKIILIQLPHLTTSKNKPIERIIELIPLILDTIQ